LEVNYLEEMPVQPGNKEIDEEVVAASEEDGEDWLFRTFDKIKT